MHNFGPFEGTTFFILAFLLYVVPVIFIIYWMVKMLRNSSQNLKIQREILKRLQDKK